MDDRDKSVFYYIQKLLQWLPTSIRPKRIWDETFTLVYQDSASLCQTGQWLGSVADVSVAISSQYYTFNDITSFLQKNEKENLIRKWQLTSPAVKGQHTRNLVKPIAAYQEFIATPIVHSKDIELNRHAHILSINDVLLLLKVLFCMTENGKLEIPAEHFQCRKIVNKLVQQVHDPLILSSCSLPEWCTELTSEYFFLFPFETREMYFLSTAFGTSRSIIWLQKCCDEILGRMHGGILGKEEQYENHIGRLRQDRVRIPRKETDILSWASTVLHAHAERKSVLEVEFMNEQGTGLGPSLEFYALVAAEFQKTSLGMWLSDGDKGKGDDQSRQVDIGLGIKPSGYYIQRSSGLFPAPIPSNSMSCKVKEVSKLFELLGLFLAKCIQDGRRVDIPLSDAFLKLMCLKNCVSESATNYGDLSTLMVNMEDSSTNNHPIYKAVEKRNVYGVEEAAKNDGSKGIGSCVLTSTHLWFRGILTIKDLYNVDSHRGKFLIALQHLIKRKKVIEEDSSLNDEEREEAINNLMFSDGSHVKDLMLNFTYTPSSSTHDYQYYELKPGGKDIELDNNNAEEYLTLTKNFILESGIRKQLESFKTGFDCVFPMEKLKIFSPYELRLILCGEQAPTWTRQEVMKYTVPKYGYTFNSPGYKKLINVLCNFSPDETKAFIQFVTGCSSLPPGGLANLHPKLTVVKKERSSDQEFPSVNTCVHYLKLPEYSSEEVMRDKLLQATFEKGFYLN